MDLRTTIAGLELTLDTLAKVNRLLTDLDERLAALSPEFPQVSALAGQSGGPTLTPGFTTLINAWEEAFTTMAARTAQLLGTVQPPIASQPAAAVPAPQPAPQPVAPAAEVSPEATAPAPVAEPVVETVAEAVAPPAAPQPAAQVAVTPAPITVSTVPDEPEPTYVSFGTNPKQRFSVTAPSGKVLREDADVAKPLKPIEMPSAEHQVGPTMATKNAVVYAHGNEIKKMWPGTRDSKISVEGPVPNDAWRLLQFGETVFCVREDGVTVLTSDLSKLGSFQGKYVGQTHTASAWAGLLVKDGQLFVEHRDAAGKPAGEAVALGAVTSDVHVAATDDSVFVALESGDVFLVQGSAAQALAKIEKGKVVGLAVDPRGLLVQSLSDQGVVLTILGFDGAVVKQAAPAVASTSHPAVLAGANAYLFDDSKSELVTVFLDTLESVHRRPVENVKSVARMLALKQEGGTAIALMAADTDGRPTDVYLLNMATGSTNKLCHISASKADMVYVDGHMAVSSTSSMQNMVQIFALFDRAQAAKAA